MRRTLPLRAGRTKPRLAPVLSAMLLASVAFAPLATSAVQAAELPLVRVVLSTAGLAQFTHAGPVTGGTAIDLPVRLDQVDDILKSLTVFDREGAVGVVSLPGKTPLEELWRDLPFGPDALTSPAALLNALVGADVEIAGPVVARGKVFRVEPVEVALPNNGGTTTRHRLTLVTSDGIVQAVLEDATALRFTDAEARGQIARALAGLAENRAKDRRRLSIGFLGQGTRQAALGYVVAAPVWKTSYRLVLPKEGGKARLQGWAVVENLTGGDWTGVELTLVSGSPVALRQQLYTAVFTDRIEVPVETAARIRPRTDDADDAPTAKRPASEAQARMFRAAPAPAAAPGRLQRSVQMEAVATARDADEIASAEVADAQEGASQLLFRVPGKVSLQTGHTMMVPFLDREVTASRVWLYQPETSPRRPLAAVRVRNDGDTSLPAGLVTTFDAAGAGGVTFAGDAQLPLLPRASTKYVTFALDQKTDIRREDRGVRRTTLGTAIDGQLTSTVRSRRTFEYEITPPAEEDREIIVEEARMPGWAPAADTKGVEETATRFRLTVAAPRATTTKARLVLENLERQSVTLTTLAPEEMLAHVRGLENESPALKDAVAKLGAIVADIAKARQERTQLEAERRRIADDQERIRRNLASVGAGTDLGRRYVETLDAQERRLGDIGKADEKAERDIAGKRREAEGVVRQLKL